MGKTVVALCLDGLTIDGKTTDLSDGKSLSAPERCRCLAKRECLFHHESSGNSVRATVNASWIDVSVGLGNCCVKVKGLLANAHENVNQIAARDGTVLTNRLTSKNCTTGLPIAGASHRRSPFCPLAGTGILKSGFLESRSMRAILIRRYSNVREQSPNERV